MYMSLGFLLSLMGWDGWRSATVQVALSMLPTVIKCLINVNRDSTAAIGAYDRFHDACLARRQCEELFHPPRRNSVIILHQSSTHCAPRITCCRRSFPGGVNTKTVPSTGCTWWRTNKSYEKI
ncbi:hypothetical protein LY76DRAFT_342913 [Colletotrichum caudatum]|nr:hypothetical protein LY76DRAFT_342913 [Colletotrichum caudatum]